MMGPGSAERERCAKVAMSLHDHVEKGSGNPMFMEAAKAIAEKIVRGPGDAIAAIKEE